MPRRGYLPCMKKQGICGLLLAFWNMGGVCGQALPVPKTNPMPVLMHYMPWFETPATNNGAWGLHWTMGNRNPNVIVNSATGQRQIASAYYPLIGPYASSDPAVMEYHLLLMKYCGVDGLLIDFYGNGGNDLPLLLRNTNAIVPKIGAMGLTFGVVFEDQFAATRAAARANMGYVGANYVPLPSYLKLNSKPLIGVFGPQRYLTGADWTAILDTLPTDPTFLTLWYASAQVGTNADGEFSWVYSDSTAGLRNFYLNRANGLGTAIGSAWPGFEPFYTQGGWGGPTWTIKPRNGQTLAQTLALASLYANRMDALQLVTWNDFGEGTMMEPTVETGFSYLAQLQSYTGVPYTTAELELIHRLYLLRKRLAGNGGAQQALDRAATDFSRVDVPGARRIIDSLEGGATGLATLSTRLKISPNPAHSELGIEGEANEPMRYRVQDLLGRTVLAGETGGVVDIGRLGTGSYVLYVQRRSGEVRARFLKE